MEWGASLADAVRTYPRDFALVFYDISGRTSDLLRTSRMLLVKEPRNLTPLISDNIKIINIHNKDIANPSKSWAHLDVGSFLNGLAKRNIQIWEWDFDYGHGFVFTWTTARVPDNVRVRDNDTIYLWNFDSKRDFLEWKRATPEKQFNAVQKLEWRKGTLVVKLYNLTWGWKTINSPFIPARVGEAFRFTFRIKGENTHGVHIKVMEFDSDENCLFGEFIKIIGSGSFDWKNVTFNYVVKNPNTSYVLLQIWHGYETGPLLLDTIQLPLPNATWPFLPSVIWLDDVRVYNITRYTLPVILNIPFRIKKSDRYELSIRYFKNQEGGEMIIRLDDTPIEIKTRDQLNRFVWKDLGTFYLGAGKHKITLQNIYGFNALNLLILIPEEDYKRAETVLENLVQNKTLVYIFEAESDLYSRNAEVIEDTNFSNGKALVLGETGRAWRYVEILNNGTYRLALRGVGKFRLRIGNKSFILRLNPSSFTYTPPFYLAKGRYRLEIAPVDVDNLVKNPSFEKISGGLPEGWVVGSTNFEVGLDRGYEGRYSLKVSTSIAKNGTWSWIRSEPIDVKPGGKYLIITHMKYRNVNASHIKIEAYYPQENKWRQLTPFIPGRKLGSTDWREYITIMKIPKNATRIYSYITTDIFNIIIKIPENATKIRVVLNAGWVLNRSRGKAVTWFDDIEVIPLDKAPKLDVVWMYSTKANQTIDRLFEVKYKPAKIISQEKIDPTLWKVKVNAVKQFMLSFAEAYDPLWEARVYKKDKLVEIVRPVPLYSVINGFWINETGSLEIVIRYKPQDWFNIGLKVSAVTFLLCMSYLFYSWRVRKKDEWALKIKEKINKTFRGIGSRFSVPFQRLRRRSKIKRTAGLSTHYPDKQKTELTICLSSGQMLVLVAATLLALSAVVLAVNSGDEANKIAILSYYFLTVGIINLLFESVKGDKWSKTRLSLSFLLLAAFMMLIGNLADVIPYFLLSLIALAALSLLKGARM